jgi:hypothetical protein
MNRKAATTQARKARKLHYIQRHGCAELFNAHTNGQISMYEALRLAHLPGSQQHQALAEKQCRIDGQQMAAATIERFLAQHGGQYIDLAELCEVVTSSILKPSKVLIRSARHDPTKDFDETL